MKTFKEECEEWLYPLGYTIHTHNPDYTHISFWNTSEHHLPEITCIYNLSKEKKVKLVGGGTRMFLSICSGELQFKHPDIERYIDTMQHYSRLCHENPPF